MSDDKIDNSKNRQLLEICGMEMFRKIQRKKLEEDEKSDNESLLNERNPNE